MCIPACVCLAHSHQGKKTPSCIKRKFISTCVLVSQPAPRTVARQALLSMGLSRQEYWSGLPFSFPEDLPNPGMEPWSAVQADSSQQGVKITQCRHKTRASGRPAHQEGNPIQLHRHQRLSPTGNVFLPGKWKK